MTYPTRGKWLWKKVRDVLTVGKGCVVRVYERKLRTVHDTKRVTFRVI